MVHIVMTGITRGSFRNLHLHLRDIAVNNWLSCGEGEVLGTIILCKNIATHFTYNIVLPHIVNMLGFVNLTSFCQQSNFC